MGARVQLFVRNAGGRFVNEGAGLVARIGLVLLAGRLAGPRALGLVALASTAAGLGLLPALGGLDMWTAVEGAKRRGAAGAEALRAVAVSAPLTAIAFVATGVLLGGDAALVLSGAGLLVVVSAPARVIRGGFAGAGRLRVTGWAGLAEAVVTLGGAIGGLTAGWGAPAAIGALVAGRGAALAVSIVLYRRFLAGDGPREPLRSRRQVVRSSLHLAVLRPMTVGLQRADTFVLAALAGAASVGLYGAATNITLSVPLVALAVSEAALPRLCRPGERDGAARGLVLLNALLGIAAAIAVVASAPFALRVLYGDAFGASVTALRILALSLPLVFVNAALAIVLLANDRVRRRLTALGAAVGVNVAANVALVPALGIAGACWSTVVSEAVLTLALAAGLVRGRAAADLVRELRPALVAAAACAAAMLAFGLGFAGLALASASVVTVLAWSLRRGLLTRIA